jgi:hypothetical protein
MVEANPSNASYRSDLAYTLLYRGNALRRCGRTAEAVSDFRQMIADLQGQKEPSPWDYYNIACAQSLLSGLGGEAGSGLTVDEGRAAAEEAMKSLRRAAAAGWRDAALLMIDTDLDPIRSRSDFRLWAMDMAFPSDPFARKD